MPGAVWRKCTAYCQTGPGGPPLALRLSRLGITQVLLPKVGQLKLTLCAGLPYSQLTHHTLLFIPKGPCHTPSQALLAIILGSSRPESSGLTSNSREPFGGKLIFPTNSGLPSARTLKWQLTMKSTFFEAVFVNKTLLIVPGSMGVLAISTCFTREKSFIYPTTKNADVNNVSPRSTRSFDLDISRVQSEARSGWWGVCVSCDASRLS